MSNLRMFGKELEIYNNPALKSMWGDLMGQAANITHEDLLTHPLVTGKGEAPDPGPTPTVQQQVRTRFPGLVGAVVAASKELEQQRLPVEKLIVRGDFVSAEAPTTFGSRSSRTYKIV